MEHFNTLPITAPYLTMQSRSEMIETETDQIVVQRIQFIEVKV